MPNRPWFRVHTSILHSRKVQELPPVLFKWLVNFWAAAATNEGWLPDPKDLAWTLRCPEKSVIAAISQLTEKRLIDQVSGRLAPHQWADWQYESDTSNERVKRFRERKRNGESRLPVTADVTVDVTVETDDVTASRARDRAEQIQSRADQRESAPASPQPPHVIQAASPIPIRGQAPADTEQRIRKLAESAPDQQDFETGVQVAAQEVISAANPQIVLETMEALIPVWWQAMRENRARMKTLRYLVIDRDYLRRPREPTPMKPVAPSVAEMLEAIE